MRRSLLAAGLVTGVVAALLGPAAPSSAFTGDLIKVPLGKTFIVKKDPIPGNSTTFQAANTPTRALTVAGGTPDDCAGEPVGCEVVPIELQIPEEEPEAIEEKGYILTVVFDWDPGERVDNVPELGTAYANNLEGFLFQDPMAIDSSGKATFTARSNSTQPANLVAVSPTSKKFELVVANYSGVNKGYTLEISLSSAADLEFDGSEFMKGEKPRDFVQPTFEIPKGSPQQNGFGGASGPAFIAPPGAGPATAPVIAGGPAPIRVPNIANGSADARLLAMSNVNVRTGLGLRAVNVSSTVATFQKKESSGLSIAIGLLALPLLAVGGFAYLMWRKRKASGPAAPTTA